MLEAKALPFYLKNFADLNELELLASLAYEQFFWYANWLRRCSEERVYRYFSWP